LLDPRKCGKCLAFVVIRFVDKGNPMLARGFDAWFFNEIKEDRVAWPGPALPASMEPAATKSG
jgi:hypothetical protein